MIGTARQVIRWLTDWLLNKKDDSQQFEIKKHHAKRTKSQNSCYWAILHKVAGAMKMSEAECHNRMLWHYGCKWTIDGEVVGAWLPDTDEAFKSALQEVKYHTVPTSEVKPGKDGKMIRAYILLRGSHEYNTKEMARLLDGCIQEANNLGIETIPPNELQEIREYEAAQERKRAERDG